MTGRAGAMLVWAQALCLGACGNAPQTGATVFGHATLRGLADHAGVTVSLSHGSATAQTDRFGYFALPDVPRGDYLVLAQADSTFEHVVSAPLVHDGVHVSQVSLSLTPFGRVTGRVVDQGHQAVPFALVRVLGTDDQTTAIEDGTFTLDPAPAGEVVLWASAGDYLPATAAVTIPRGTLEDVLLVLGDDVGPGPYAQNRAPEIDEITLTAVPDFDFPQVIPLVDTLTSTSDSGESKRVVRRGGLYRLSIEARDPDHDPVSVFFTADRGTLSSTVGEPPLGEPQGPQFATTWHAGDGVSTLTCTVLDPYGQSAQARLVVEAAGDNLRGAGRFGDAVYYSERRGATFDLFRYDFVTGQERVFAAGALQQHAAQVSGEWLIWADSEFVFIGDLIYRVRAQNLVTGTSLIFGQDFDHDSNFVTRIELYTPHHGTLLPYYCSNPDLCWPGTTLAIGYGYFDLDAGTTLPTPALNSESNQPVNLHSVWRKDGRDYWLSLGSRLWQQDGNNAPVLLYTFDTDGQDPVDLQCDGQTLAFLPADKGPLYVYDLGGAAPPRQVGYAVTSFALYGEHIAYVEQGPTSASVELVTLPAGVSRTLSHEPYFARRLWFIDEDFVIWGDQGSEGQTFVELNTERLWLDRL